jgi:hypothetical protein
LDYWSSPDITEEVVHPLGTGQASQVPDDDAAGAFANRSIGRRPSDLVPFCLDNSILDLTTGGIKTSKYALLVLQVMTEGCEGRKRHSPRTGRPVAWSRVVFVEQLAIC